MLQLHQIHLPDWISSNVAPDFRMQAFRFYFVFPVRSCYLLRWSAWSNDFKWQWNQAKQLHHSSCVAWQILMSSNHKDRFVDIFGIVYHNRKTSCFVAWACALHHWRSFVLFAWWQVCRCSLHLGENAFLAKFRCSCWSWRWCCAWSCWRFAKAASMSVLTRPAIAWHSGACCATLRYSFATTSRPRKCFSNFSLPPSSRHYDIFQSKACKEITKNESVRYLEKWKWRFVLHLLLLISMS